MPPIYRNEIELCSKLRETVYLVHSFEGDDPYNSENGIGTGSGVAIDDQGHLITAAHVLMGEIPKDY